MSNGKILVDAINIAIKEEMGFELYAWQKEYIYCPADATLPTGRGTGKTLACILREIAVTELRTSEGAAKYLRQSKRLGDDYFRDPDYNKNRDWHERKFEAILDLLIEHGVIRGYDGKFQTKSRPRPKPMTLEELDRLLEEERINGEI